MLNHSFTHGLHNPLPLACMQPGRTVTPMLSPSSCPAHAGQLQLSITCPARSPPRAESGSLKAIGHSVLSTTQIPQQEGEVRSQCSCGGRQTACFHAWKRMA